MIAPWPYWALVFVVHVGWAFALPGRQGKAIAVIGAASALLALAARVWTRDARVAALALIPFLLPILSFAAQPRVVFYGLDGRAWLIAAWLIVSAWALRRAGRAQAVPVTLFLLWTSIFWLTVVWDLGVREYILDFDKAPDRVAMTSIFQVWETHPVSEHLFLGWRREHAFEMRTVYANHVHPYLMSMYAWVGVVRAVTGLPMQTARFGVPLLYMIVLLASTIALLARLDLLRRAHTVRTQVILFLAFGFLITTWRFWRDQLLGTGDDPFPLEAALFVLVYASLIPPARPRLALIGSTLFVAMAPAHLPWLILAVVCLFGQAGPTLRETLARNRLPVRIVLVAAIVGVIVMAMPPVLIAWKGYTAESSSLLFRSGLDGDTQYFRHMWQALWAPTEHGAWARTADKLFLPAFVPLAIAAPWMWRTRDPEGAELRRLLLFLITPYLGSLILFPQAVSIHPYMFDLFLILPIVVGGVAFVLMAPIERRIVAGGLLLFLLIAGWLIMANLTALAQVLRGTMTA